MCTEDWNIKHEEERESLVRLDHIRLWWVLLCGLYNGPHTLLQYSSSHLSVWMVNDIHSKTTAGRTMDVIEHDQAFSLLYVSIFHIHMYMYMYIFPACGSLRKGESEPGDEASKWQEVYMSLQNCFLCLFNTTVKLTHQGSFSFLWL